LGGGSDTTPGPGTIGSGNPGGGGGIGSGGSGAAPSFQNAQKGAQSFLDALKSKDIERVSEATALRSQYEAKTADHRQLFNQILSKTIEQADVNKLADLFEGMTIQDMNTVKSSGQVGVIVGKTKGQERVTRTLTVRHEKAGWKVMDFSDARQYIPGNAMNRKTTARKSR